VLVLLLAGGVIGWHLYVAASMDHEYRLAGNATLVSVNPITDVVTWDLKIEVDMLNRENPPISHMGEVMVVDEAEKRALHPKFRLWNIGSTSTPGNTSMCTRYSFPIGS
jgi:hypothetical protein